MVQHARQRLVLMMNNMSLGVC